MAVPAAVFFVSVLEGEVVRRHGLGVGSKLDPTEVGGAIPQLYDTFGTSTQIAQLKHERYPRARGKYPHPTLRPLCSQHPKCLRGWVEWTRGDLNPSGFKS